MYEPIIKWTGSKRSQAEEIVKEFPKEIDTYYEPFIGGGSILYRLLDSDIKVNRFICSDINQDLINLWNEIKNNPDRVYEHYNNLWTHLVNLPDIKAKQDFYNDIRKKYNEEHSPLDFMFINRTCFNGMPRYNKKGEFNSPYHLTRNGITSNKFLSIIKEWSTKIKNVEFICQSYDKISPSLKDFIYLDPPYANTKSVYYGGIDLQKFFEFLAQLPCKYVVSFDGKRGDRDYTYKFPEELYTEHRYLTSGSSSLINLNKLSTQKVFESLYIKGDK